MDCLSGSAPPPCQPSPSTSATSAACCFGPAAASCAAIGGDASHTAGPASAAAAPALVPTHAPCALAAPRADLGAGAAVLLLAAVPSAFGSAGAVASG